MPIILIGISVAVFFMFSNPFYKDIGQLRAKADSYNEALDNSKALENERDKLTAKDNSINPDDKIRLQKLLPENIDNIRLILEIEQIALPYGMVLKDIKYSGNETKKDASNTGTTPAVVQGGAAASASSKDYGVWDLEFSTVGSYDNFLNFTRDLEKNLRIVDVSSIQFSSDTSSGVGGSSGSANPSSESYKYSFKIKTYWLKN